MIEPSLALQKAVVAALKADAALQGLVGGRVFDRVPGDAAYPYVSLGDETVVDDGDQCHAGAETSLTLDVWSDEVGRVQAKQIAARVAAVLDAELAVDGHQVVVHAIEQVRHFPGTPDLIAHSAVVVRYVTAPAS